MFGKEIETFWLKKFFNKQTNSVQFVYRPKQRSLLLGLDRINFFFVGAMKIKIFYQICKFLWILRRKIGNNLIIIEINSWSCEMICVEVWTTYDVLFMNLSQSRIRKWWNFINKSRNIFWWVNRDWVYR